MTIEREREGEISREVERKRRKLRNELRDLTRASMTGSRG